jgi:hypothetical protein
VLDLTPAVALLQSEDAAGLLRAALTGSADIAVPDLSAELTTWQYRPGAEVTAGYRVSYSGGGGEVVDHLFATTAEVGPPAATVAAGPLAFRVWRHPHDPRLPGLAAACDPDEVQAWPGVGPGLSRLDLLGYRPLRRAVLRATSATGDTYVKVLRPERAEHLAVRQRLFAEAGLTPALAGRPAPGVLVTPAADGVSLATMLAGPDDLPGPAVLVEVLDRLPAGLVELARRPAWSDRLDFHAATASQRLPDQAGRIEALVPRIRRVLATVPVGAVVPTHGDFYEANVMVAGDRLGLIDLENAGPGLREDDLACLLAHLAVLPGLSPTHYGRVPDVLAEWTRDFSARVHPAALAARVAGVLLSLVAGGEDDQARHRLDLAESWALRSMREPSSAGSGPTDCGAASLNEQQEAR